MKTGTKVFYSLMLILFIAVAAAIMLVALGVIPIETAHEILEGMVQIQWANILWIVGTGIIIILSITCIGVGFSKGSKPQPKSVEVVENANGTAHVTVAALVELTQRCLNDVHGIVSQSIQIFKSIEGSGILVKLVISVKPDIEIPATSELIMKNVTAYLDTYGGIHTSEVKVTVVPLKHVSASKVG